jgi:HlyD family secretion protein
MARKLENENMNPGKKKGLSRAGRTWLIIGLVVVVAAGAFAIYRVRANATAASSYQTTTLARGNLNATIGATGNVRANQTAIISWQTSGTVDSVDAVVGDQVGAGITLASLSTTSLAQNVVMARADLVAAQQNLSTVLNSNTQRAQAQLNLADAQKSANSATDTLSGLLATNHGGTSADITYARAQLTLAQQSYDQAKNFYDNVKDRPDTDSLKAQAYTSFYNAQQALWRAQGNLNYYLQVPSGSDIDVARAKLALAQAQLADAQREWDRLKNGPDQNDVAAAQARVDAAQATLNYSRLAAPFAGTVTEADPMVGDQVSPGTIGFRVDDLSRLQVDVQVSEVDINNVVLGQPAVVTFDAVAGKEYHGKVVHVSRVGTSVQSVVNFSVTVELTDPDADVKPGMTASVTITIQSLENVLLVPNSGVHLINSQRVVYILRNGQLMEIPVTLGASDDTKSVVVSGDLSVGDILVLNPPTNFTPGRGGGGGARSIFGGG